MNKHIHIYFRDSVELRANQSRTVFLYLQADGTYLVLHKGEGAGQPQRPFLFDADEKHEAELKYEDLTRRYA